MKISESWKAYYKSYLKTVEEQARAQAERAYAGFMNRGALMPGHVENHVAIMQKELVNPETSD